jgi:hypothetical protein
MGNYKDYRKRKLTGPRDHEFFPLTYLKQSPHGRVYRVLDGVCEECGGLMTVMWSNFAGEERGRRGRRYTFMHKSCSDARWRRELAEQKTKVPKEHVYEKLMQKYRAGANRRTLVFELPLAVCSAMFEASCHWCGALPRPHNHWKHVSVNGIDRLDNTKGYLLDNVVPCCTSCNFIKKDTPLAVWQQFIEGVRRVR